MAKTVLVTGVSSGIGEATAIYLAQNGYNVYGAARRVEKMQNLKPHGIKPISLDLTQDESIVACVEQILQEAGSIDLLINNAGSGFYGSLEVVNYLLQFSNLNKQLIDAYLKIISMKFTGFRHCF